MLQTSNNLELTFIQCVGTVSAAAGVRVGAYLSQIVPQLQHFCEEKEEDEEMRGDAEEQRVNLWENVLQAFQAIVRNCPAKVRPKPQIQFHRIYIYKLSFVRFAPPGHSIRECVHCHLPVKDDVRSKLHLQRGRR